MCADIARAADIATVVANGVLWNEKNFVPTRFSVVFFRLWSIFAVGYNNRWLLMKFWSYLIVISETSLIGSNLFLFENNSNSYRIFYIKMFIFHFFIFDALWKRVFVSLYKRFGSYVNLLVLKWKSARAFVVLSKTLQVTLREGYFRQKFLLFYYLVKFWKQNVLTYHNCSLFFWKRFANLCLSWISSGHYTAVD